MCLLLLAMPQNFNPHPLSLPALLACARHVCLEPVAVLPLAGNPLRNNMLRLQPHAYDLRLMLMS